VIDTATNTVIATVPVGIFPQEITITPNGAFAYLVNVEDNTASVIDTATNTVIATPSVGSRPTGIDITPNGAFAYVSNQFADAVSVLATASNTIVTSVPVGSVPNGLAVGRSLQPAQRLHQPSASVHQQRRTHSSRWPIAD